MLLSTRRTRQRTVVCIPNVWAAGARPFVVGGAQLQLCVELWLLWVLGEDGWRHSLRAAGASCIERCVERVGKEQCVGRQVAEEANHLRRGVPHDGRRLRVTRHRDFSRDEICAEGRRDSADFASQEVSDIMFELETSEFPPYLERCGSGQVGARSYRPPALGLRDLGVTVRPSWCDHHTPSICGHVRYDLTGGALAPWPSSPPRHAEKWRAATCAATAHPPPLRRGCRADDCAHCRVRAFATGHGRRARREVSPAPGRGTSRA